MSDAKQYGCEKFALLIDRNGQPTMYLYEVRTPGGQWLKFRARNATDAKRKYCAWAGFTPSDPFTGISYLQARRVSANE